MSQIPTNISFFKSLQAVIAVLQEKENHLIAAS